MGLEHGSVPLVVEERGDGGGGERGVGVKEGDGSGIVGEEDVVVGVGS